MLHGVSESMLHDVDDTIHSLNKFILQGLLLALKFSLF